MLVDYDDEDRGQPLYLLFEEFDYKKQKRRYRKTSKPSYTKISCLKCSLVFRSWDTKCNRICSKCRRDNKKKNFSSSSGGESFSIQAESMSHLNHDPSVSDLVEDKNDES